MFSRLLKSVHEESEERLIKCRARFAPREVWLSECGGCSDTARERKDKSMSLKLAAEIIAASNGEGNAIKKREDTHKMAEANKAFAHYRW